MSPTDTLEMDQRILNGKQLTTRQEEILIALCTGQPYRLVAQKVGITEGTLRVFMSRLMSVTGKNRTELALMGYQLSRRRAEIGASR